MRARPASPARGSRLADHHPVTPDGRYIVVRARLWRTSNPELSAGERQRLVLALTTARRGAGAGRRIGDWDAVRDARRRVDDAKVELGSKDQSDGRTEHRSRPAHGDEDAIR